MSADSVGTSRSPDSEQSTQPGPAKDKASGEEQGPVLEEEYWSEGRSRDCVICQNAAVNRVLLPCRHACVCDGCVSHFQHCPICRAFVLESFTLTQGLATEHWLYIINYIISLYRIFFVFSNIMNAEKRQRKPEWLWKEKCVQSLKSVGLCSIRQSVTL